MGGPRLLPARAHLHAAAQKVVSENEGELPRSADELRKLPGIGPYTAGAIASVAFGADEPAVDGNAIRVLSRLFDIEDQPNSGPGKRAFWAAARDILPQGQASDFNQGLMDLGARVCLPRNPRCEGCPLAEHCEAFRMGIQDLRPARKVASALPVRHLVSFVVQQNARVLLRQRPQEALLGAMWEFPNLELEPEADDAQLHKAIQEELGFAPQALHPMSAISHIYSHFQAQVRVFNVERPLQIAETPKSDNEDWVSLAELDQRPMGKIDRSIANQLMDVVG